jgi:hypothetical protein
VQDDIEVLLKSGDPCASDGNEERQDQTNAVQFAGGHVTTPHQVFVSQKNQNRAHQNKGASNHQAE